MVWGHVYKTLEAFGVVSAAIRDSFDSYDDDDPLRVAVDKASDEELMEVSEMIIGSDPTWSDFHSNIDMCVREVFEVKDA